LIFAASIEILIQTKVLIWKLFRELFIWNFSEIFRILIYRVKFVALIGITPRRMSRKSVATQTSFTRDGQTLP
jgi:hypothetical protein